jgi:hypothetical protein
MDLVSTSCTEKTRFDENKINGILAEIIAVEDYRSYGYQIKRTGIGSDFIAFKEINGKVEQIYVEVKYGNASLSTLQKRQKFLAKKHSIGFDEYRVTKVFLENYKKEHNINTKNLNADELRESFYQVCSRTAPKRLFRIELPWICPHCRQTIAESEDELVEEFGMRKMSNGTIRNQSWCRRCR